MTFADPKIWSQGVLTASKMDSSDPPSDADGWAMQATKTLVNQIRNNPNQIDNELVAASEYLAGGQAAYPVPYETSDEHAQLKQLDDLTAKAARIRGGKLAGFDASQLDKLGESQFDRVQFHVARLKSIARVISRMPAQKQSTLRLFAPLVRIAAARPVHRAKVREQEFADIRKKGLSPQRAIELIERIDLIAPQMVRSESCLVSQLTRGQSAQNSPESSLASGAMSDPFGNAFESLSSDDYQLKPLEPTRQGERHAYGSTLQTYTQPNYAQSYNQPTYGYGNDGAQKRHHQKRRRRSATHRSGLGAGGWGGLGAGGSILLTVLFIFGRVVRVSEVLSRKPQRRRNPVVQPIRSPKVNHPVPPYDYRDFEHPRSKLPNPITSPTFRQPRIPRPTIPRPTIPRPGMFRPFSSRPYSSLTRSSPNSPRSPPGGRHGRIR